MAAITEYHRPRELTEALRLLQRPDVRTVPLAGGVALVGAAPGEPHAVVDLQDLGLDFITVEPPKSGATGGPSPLRAGAMTRVQALCDSDLVRELAHGVLAEAARRSASYTLREQATIGGTLVTGYGANPLLATLLALDAEVVVWAGKDPRQVPIDSFLAYGAHLVGHRALITELRVPRFDALTGAALEAVARTPADEPLVCAAARVFRNRDTGRAYGVRVAVGGVAPLPVRIPAAERVLEGQVVSGALLGQLGDAIGRAVAPAGDWRASADYRLAMAKITARRAVEAAWAV